MPETIFHNDFSSGWVPSDNYINGRKNGLLQMDNLCLDDNGALISAKGISALSGPLNGVTHTLFAATISGVQKQLAALSDGSVMEGPTFTNSLFPGGSTSRAAFANVLDQILICSGTINKKWDGTTLRNAGIIAPVAAPTVTSNASVVLSVANLDGSNEFTNWSLIDGTEISDNPKAWKVNPSSVNNLGQATTVFASNFDTGNFPNGSPADLGDVFRIPLTISDGTQIGGIQVEFYPDDGAGGLDYANRLFFVFDNSNTTFPITSGSVVLQCFRADFNNNSPTVPFSAWSIIRHIRVYFYGTAFLDYTFGDFTFTGSTTAVLTGSYEYLQVDVFNTGKYVAQSAVSPISTVNPSISSVHVTPSTSGIDPQVNEIWIFRRNTATEQDYYRIAVVTSPYSAFDDYMQDTDAEELDITANLFLSTLSVLSTGIKAIVGLWFERVLYFDDKNIYFSDRLNADSIDTRKTVTYSGNTSEVFLWAIKVTNSVIIVATDLDNYELTGTFNELPDGTLDISFRPLAIKNPAISIAAAAYSSSVVYQAADGWRIFDGVNSTPLSENFDILFKNQAKYGYAPISDGYFAGQLFANCAIANKKIYTTQKDTNGTYKCFVYDLSRKYWYPYVDGLYSLAVKDDGTLIGSSFVDNRIYSLELNSGNPVRVNALFVVENSAPPANITASSTSPRNRKDSYTFKCNINTNGYSLNIYIYKNRALYGTTPVLIGTINTNSLQQIILDISSSIGIVDSWQIKFSGIVDGLILSDYSIDFDARPTQLTYLRKSPDNFGSAAIKQLSVLPFVIDTIGTRVGFTPVVDGNVFPTQYYTTLDKKTCFYYFQSDTLMIDVGGYFQGGLFEFYGWLQPELLEIMQVTRIFDNTGPIEFTKNARFIAVRFRLFPLGSSIQFTVLADEVNAYSVEIPVVPNKELVYESILPRGINGTVFQLEHKSNDGLAFAKLSIEYKAIITGGQTDNGWKKA